MWHSTPQHYDSEYSELDFSYKRDSINIIARTQLRPSRIGVPEEGPSLMHLEF